MPAFIRSSRTNPSMLRALDVRPDDSDARDYVYTPLLGVLPKSIDNRKIAPVLDQGSEGACVGFALATVINVGLARRSSGASNRRRRAAPVSPRMLYEMGRRYDEWKGESYDGTSLRGAMKGWHKHGVTTEALWPFRVRRGGRWAVDRELTAAKARDALRRPIGAYFRILDSDASHLQAAIAEGDAVLASAWTHRGWQSEALVGRGLKRIPSANGTSALHAFAIVGYTRDGLIIQNSWGENWGSRGYALLAYEDWLENRQDAWVARPGPETRASNGEPRIFVVGFAGSVDGGRAELSLVGTGIDPEVARHIVNTGDRGDLKSDGSLQTRREDLPTIAAAALGPFTPDTSTVREVVLYAHGGLDSESEGLSIAGRLLKTCNDTGVGIAFFVWETGILESLRGWLRSDDDARGPASAGLRDLWEKIKKGAGNLFHAGQRKLGEELAPVVRTAFWDEMKGRAAGAATAKGGGALFVDDLLRNIAQRPKGHFRLHLVGHSAGSIYLADLYERKLAAALAGSGTQNVTLGSIQFMAPAITMNRAERAFVSGATPAVPKERFRVYMLSPDDENTDGIYLYPSSLLTYVADCLEDANQRIPVLGIRTDFDSGTRFAVASAASGQTRISHRHGEFVDDGYEVCEILARIAAKEFDG